AFLGDGRVRALRGVRLDWVQDNGRPVMKEIAGSEFDLDCDLVLLALGFLGPESDTVISQLGCELTERGNLKAGPDYQTTVPGVRLRRRAATPGARGRIDRGDRGPRRTVVRRA